MSIKRRQKRAAQAHSAKLADMLGGFYEFLARPVQPSDEEVRATFIRYDHCWRQYCSKKQLSKSAYDMFRIQVAQLWEQKKAKSQGENMN